MSGDNENKPTVRWQTYPNDLPYREGECVLNLADVKASLVNPYQTYITISDRDPLDAGLIVTYVDLLTGRMKYVRSEDYRQDQLVYFEAFGGQKQSMVESSNSNLVIYEMQADPKDLKLYFLSERGEVLKTAYATYSTPPLEATLIYDGSAPRGTRLGQLTAMHMHKTFVRNESEEGGYAPEELGDMLEEYSQGLSRTVIRDVSGNTNLVSTRSIKITNKPTPFTS